MKVKTKYFYAGMSSKGSMTLFLALILTLVFSFFFSLLEAARVQGLSKIAKRSTLLQLESALGEYQADLWENYNLLFLDAGNSAGELDLVMLEGRRMEEEELRKKSAGFYQLALQSLEITSYSLATDHNGAAFEKQACKAIKKQLAAGTAEAVKQKLKMGEEMAQKSQSMEKQWESAKDAMAEAENWEDMEADKGKGGDGAFVPQNPSVPEEYLPPNPVDSVDLLKKSAILAIVVENPNEVSSKTISLQDTLKRRKKEEGNLQQPEHGTLDKLWFLQYLNGYFGCKTRKGKKNISHALDYELEYCVAGTSSDCENLEKTVKELLLIREAGNFTTIMQDGKKQALATELAAAAVGFTGMAPLIYAVKVGILLAWSYLESILDVRCLLAGGKVPLVKSAAEWKSDVSLGEEILQDKKEQSESQEKGLDYQEYLQFLLLLVKEETLVWRAMDIIEQNIKLKESAFRMDHQLHGMEIEGLYTASPLFLGFITAVKIKGGTYQFRERGMEFYLE